MLLRGEVPRWHLRALKGIAWLKINLHMGHLALHIGSGLTGVTL